MKSRIRTRQVVSERKYRDFLLEVVVQAVRDYERLVKHKAIIDGKASRDFWLDKPPKYRIIEDYKDLRSVEVLILFFKGNDIDDLLEHGCSGTDCYIDGETIRRHLGL